MKPSLPPIVLMTDFGHLDPYVGILKGVIHGIAPHAGIIDLSHGIRPQDIRHGAFALYRSYAYFPKGSIFCAVVDPGVGTGRMPVAVRTHDYLFVGPDNGLLWPSAHACGIDTSVCLENSEFFLDRISTTFHGRDIFAPVAAHLWMGTPLEKMGRKADTLCRLEFPEPEFRGKTCVLTILDQDTYGNLVLNISHESFFQFAGSRFRLESGDVRISKVCTTYGQAVENTPFVLAGSHGFMEIAVKNGSAAAMTGVGVLDRFTLTPGSL
ncbi:MAG: SAM-dependent chlorinase/fluorinase [Desulfobacter sp.]